MKKKRIFTDKGMGYFDPDIILNCEIDGTIAIIKTIKKDLTAEGVTDIQFKWIEEYEYCAVEIWGERLETDEEFEKRKRKADGKLTRLKNRMNKDKKLYEKLKDLEKDDEKTI
jgi:hypothetical protein